MISLLNELEILGAEIDAEMQVDIVLQSLLESFKQFYLNYNINKFSYTLVELLKELQTAESLNRKSGRDLVIEKGFASKLKGKKKQKKVQKQAMGPVQNQKARE